MDAPYNRPPQDADDDRSLAWHRSAAARLSEPQWIGNSRTGTLLVTDVYFAEAAKEPVQQAPANTESPAEGAAQNPAQYPAERSGTDRKTADSEKQNRPGFPSDSASYRSLPSTKLGAEGFEPSKA
jgi:hypothetical protein